MKRRPDELVEYLLVEDDHPHGVFLMTGTGVVPDKEFTLLPGDEVEIEIEGVGVLENRVVQSDRNRRQP
jgi:2-dehydro-3-deoxy-D-arabinonate dehydratase